MLIDTLDGYPRSTLDRHLIDTRSTFHRHFGWHSINTLSTSRSRVGREWTSFRSVYMRRKTLDRLLTDYWSSVDRVSTENRWGCRRVPIEMSIEGIDQHSTADAFGTHFSCLLVTFFSILGCTENVNKSFGRLDVTYTSKFDPYCNWIISHTGTIQTVAIVSINQIYFGSSRYTVFVTINLI